MYHSKQNINSTLNKTLISCHMQSYFLKCESKKKKAYYDEIYLGDIELIMCNCNLQFISQNKIYIFDKH